LGTIYRLWPGISYVVHEPLPHVRDWDVALGLPELPETLKFVALMTRSMFGEPHAAHFISTDS
jgi:hypothetical protein